MKKLPNSLDCFVCGLDNEHGLKLKFYQQDDGSVVVRHIVPEQYQGYPGTVHGGILASMFDEVLGRVFMDGDFTRFMYTARLTIRYRKPVPTGVEITIIGRAVRDRGRAAESKAELYGPDGQLLAEADALMIDLPQEIDSAEELAALGWKVYPDEEDQP